MIILGIDYGTKNIGLALWRDQVDVVLPFGVKHNVADVVDLVNIEKVDRIVIGLPIALDGKKDNFNIDRVKKFANEIKKQVSVAIEFYDERFSSQQADRMGEGVSRDEKSAMVILQGYLESSK